MIELTQFVATEPEEATIVGKATASDARIFVEKTPGYRLVLNLSRGWDGDLAAVADAFKAIPVKKLSLFGGAGMDVGALSQFAELEELQVAGLVHGVLNLDWFGVLKRFGFGAEVKGKHRVALDWGQGRALLQVSGKGSTLPSAEVLASFPHLQSLSVVKPVWTPEALTSLPELNTLDMSYWGGLRTMSQLGVLLGRITNLSLYQASKLTDYEGIEQMRKLTRLCLHKCPVFPSVKLLEKLPILKELLLIDTKLTDGDLTPLYTFPSLRQIGMASYRHYVPSAEVMTDFFDSKLLECP